MKQKTSNEQKCFVQVGEDEGVPVYSEVEMSDENNPDYKWRPATKGDIGSIARFGDTDSKHEPWTYGILRMICEDGSEDAPTGFVYMCEPGPEYDEEMLPHFYCQIQYDANKEP